MATGRDSSYWATVVFKQYFFAVLFIKLDWSIEVNHFKKNIVGHFISLALIPDTRAETAHLVCRLLVSSYDDLKESR